MRLVSVPDSGVGRRTRTCRPGCRRHVVTALPAEHAPGTGGGPPTRRPKAWVRGAVGAGDTLEATVSARARAIDLAWLWWERCRHREGESLRSKAGDRFAARLLLSVESRPGYGSAACQPMPGAGGRSRSRRAGGAAGSDFACETHPGSARPAWSDGRAVHPAGSPSAPDGYPPVTADAGFPVGVSHAKRHARRARRERHERTGQRVRGNPTDARQTPVDGAVVGRPGRRVVSGPRRVGGAFGGWCSW